MARKHKYYKSKKRAGKIVRSQHKHSKESSTALNINAIKLALAALFFAASIGWFFYFFFISDNFFIKTVNISGNKNIPKKDLREITKKVLEQKHFLFIPGKNIILFDTSKLLTEIKNQYIVESLEIDKDYPFSLNIEITEKLARVVLRAKTPIVKPAKETSEEGSQEEDDDKDKKNSVESHNIEEGKQQNEEGRKEDEKQEYSENYYYIDVNGIVVSSGKVKDTDIFELPIIEIELAPDKKINPGEAVMDRNKIEFVFSVYEMVSRIPENVSVEYVIYNPDIENEFKFVTSEGWQGFLTSDISLETQIKKLDVALRETIQTPRKSLKHVDLRIKDRIYFK